MFYRFTASILFIYFGYFYRYGECENTPEGTCRTCQTACEAAYPPLADKIIGICRPGEDDCAGYTGGPLDRYFYDIGPCEGSCCCGLKNTCMDFCKERGQSSLSYFASDD